MRAFWRKISLLVAIAALLCITAAPAGAIPVTLSDVPAYNWYHGCSPTAGGQLFGYWDGNGYADLFAAAGADVLLTANVQDEIASPGHIADYWGNPDPLAEGHTDDSIADFMGTSRGSLANGWTYLSHIDDGIEDYAAFRGYNDWTATNVLFGGSFGWADLVAEIDVDRPLLLTVDSNGNGTADHSVTGIGYDDRGTDGLWYACFNTWHEDETVDWYQFRGVSDSYGWGVYNATLVLPSAPDSPTVPVPGAFVLGLFGIGLVGIVRKRLS